MCLRGKYWINFDLSKWNIVVVDFNALQNYCGREIGEIEQKHDGLYVETEQNRII